ncbi:hypothetical protein PRIPAC_87340 [Pristionchus pacificus]|uniref:Uncharacterized protein n=1 Tax=Pristionchus pacificus TaxID=54126 RepID=A0A2A6B7P1_PRIPA|nr:hypothetical protein PRIPAC_87340 [Pristionchus pacificus]|eukprot:PDM61884.1 hypothetical protein PRIPAC_51326 [Pristionchus pacificus]
MHDGDVAPRPGIAAQNGVNHNNNQKSPSTWRRQPLQNGNVRSKTLSYARSIVASIEEEHDSLYTSMDEEDNLPETAPKKSISTPRLRVSVGPMPNRVPVVPPSLSDYSAFPSSLRHPSRERTAVQYGTRQESESRFVPPPPPRPSEESLQQVRRQRSSSQPPELTRQRLREFTQTYENGSRVVPSDTASVASSRGSSSFLASGIRSDRTTSIRSQWEAACVKDETDARSEALRVSRSRGYSFPKWRSNDALSASLVASNEKGAVHIPVDSRIPEDRQRKMMQTEVEARETKVLIHREANLARKPSLHRGRSVDAVNMQLDHSPWYDEREIQGGIERESIGNLQRTRARFETPIHSTVNSRLTSPQPPPPSSHPAATAHPRRLIIDERSSPPSSDHRLTPPNQPMARVAPSSHLGGSSLSLSSRLSPEEARLVQFLRQNAQVATSLGISIPPDLMRDVITSYAHSEPVQSLKYEEFPSSMTSSYRRTEIVARDEQEISLNASALFPILPPNRYRTSSYRTLLALQQISPMASSTSSDQRYARRPMSPSLFPRRQHELVRGVPENRKEAAQALEGRYGADLIAAEMRLQREREADLRRSRSQLGLPDLQDTLQLWRQGYRGLSTNCLASASSFDHGLNHEFGRMSKAQSITALTRARQSTVAANGSLVVPSTDVHLEEQVENYKNYVEASTRLIDSLNLYETKPLTIVRDRQSSQSIVATDTALLAPKLAPIKIASESLATTSSVHRDWTAHELAHYARTKPIIANYTNWMRDQGAPGIQEIRTMQMARNQYDAALVAHTKKPVPEKKKKLDQTKDRFEAIKNSLVTTKFNTIEKTYDEHREVCIELFKEMKSFHMSMVSVSEAPFTSLLGRLDEAAKKNTPTMSEEKVDNNNNNNKPAPAPAAKVATPIKKLVEPAKDDGQYECLDNMK